MPTLLEQAVAHIKAGEIEKARPLLVEVLKQNPNDETTWLWMTKCVIETEQQRYCLEKVLSINPQNQYALRSLRYLTKPVPPPTQPKVIQQKPVQPIQKWGLGDSLLTFATFGIGLFLVLLCLYAWWVAR